MQALLDVILPVFLLIGFGYVAAWRGLFNDNAVDGVMRFAQNFAVPCLLFRSIATLDLSAAYDIGLLASFYAGAFAGFAAGFFGARLIFGRPVTDSIPSAFAACFPIRCCWACRSPNAPMARMHCRAIMPSSRCMRRCCMALASP